MSFRIEQPEVIKEQFYPEYLQQDIKNFKAKHAILDIKQNSADDMAIKFFQLAKDRDLEIIHEIKKIHRVKRGTKERLVYSDNLRLLDKEGNEVKQHLLTLGTSRHPIIEKGQNKAGEPILVPGGTKITHDIEFNAKEVDRIVKLCHPDYRDQISYSYSEVPNNSKEPFNLMKKYNIRSEQIFKTATNSEIKKMIEQKKQTIESLSELYSPLPSKP